MWFSRTIPITVYFLDRFLVNWVVNSITVERLNHKQMNTHWGKKKNLKVLLIKNRGNLYERYEK